MIRFQIFLSALIVIQLQAAMNTQFTFNDHTYQIYDDLRSWSDAQSYAASLTFGGASGYLAEINSAAENTAILNALQANDSSFTQTASDGGNARYAWIGANDNQNEGTWVWDNSGTNFWTGNGQSGSAQGGNYHNWGRNVTFNMYEPDDYLGNQDAGAIALDSWPTGAPFSIGAAGQWNDLNSTNTMPYIVEYNAVPEYSQMALALGLGSLGALFLRRHRSRSKSSN